MTIDAGVPGLSNPLRELVGFNLRSASFATMSSLAAAYEPLALKIIEATIIRLIHSNPGCYQSELGREMKIQRTNLVPIVSGLVKGKLVRRNRIDGRTIALHLTPEGEALHDRIVAIASAQEEMLFGNFSPAERGALITLFKTVCEIAHRSQTSSGSLSDTGGE